MKAVIKVIVLLIACLVLRIESKVTQFERLASDGRDLAASLVLLTDTSNSSNKVGSNFTPVVFWHGMGDTAYGSINVERLALQSKYPGMLVYSVQIGGNALEDELSGYFVNVNQQIDSTCKAIISNERIKQHGSFNGIGFSQGAQFLRGLVQRCPLRENGIRVKNLISLGGQHQGVYGLPNCPSRYVCDYVRYLLTQGAYERQVQEHLVQAEYWHDPLDETQYRAKNIFIADINNERSINQTYKDNLLAIDNLVLVKFRDDEMVVPRESSLFGFFEPGQKERILPMTRSRLYKEDRIGLKQLNESGRLHLIEVDGGHLQYRIRWFMDEIAKVYLVG